MVDITGTLLIFLSAPSSERASDPLSSPSWFNTHGVARAREGLQLKPEDLATVGETGDIHILSTLGGGGGGCFFTERNIGGFTRCRTVSDTH